MKKLLRIEGIPKPGAIIYSAIVAKSPIMKDFYHMVAEEVLSKMSSGKILDIGTGPGYLPLEIGQRSQGIEIKAIDISPAMVEIAEQNSQKMGLSERVEFLFGSAEKIPFEQGYFDLIVSTGSFHHWAQPKECLKEIHRVLKNGGEAWIYDLRRDITKEAKLEARKRYGLLLSSFFLYIVRLHSSVRAQEVQELLSSPELPFSSKEIADRWIILKQELKK
jgi:ubiquinone/menaquinone biosynthesis C-methylase UbiE